MTKNLMGGPAERQPCWVVLNTHCLPPTDGILPEWEYRVKERTQCTQGGRASEGSFPERGRHPSRSQDEMDSARNQAPSDAIALGRREVSPQAPSRRRIYVLRSKTGSARAASWSRTGWGRR